MSAKLIKECLSLGYGPIILEETFPFVSRRAKSVPGQGTAAFKTRHLNPRAIGKVFRYIRHRHGDITIVCDAGYIRFWVPRDKKFWSKLDS